MTTILENEQEKSKFHDNFYKVNSKQFITEMTPLSVYILGLIWADGHINEKTNQISLSTTYPDADYFIPLFQSLGEWNIYKYEHKNHPTWKISCQIVTSNYFLSNFLKEHDYISKSWLSADKILSVIPDTLRPYWFLGLLDGDGCIMVYKNNKQKYGVVFSSGLDQNWEFVETLCKKINVNYSIQRVQSKHGNSSKFIMYGIKNCLIFLDFIYKNHDYGLPRKREKYKELLQINQIQKYKGVCFDKKRGWKAYTKTTKKEPQKHLGFFSCEETAIEAVKAYYQGSPPQ